MMMHSNARSRRHAQRCAVTRSDAVTRTSVRGLRVGRSRWGSRLLRWCWTGTYRRRMQCGRWRQRQSRAGTREDLTDSGAASARRFSAAAHNPVSAAKLPISVGIGPLKAPFRSLRKSAHSTGSAGCANESWSAGEHAREGASWLGCGSRRVQL